MASSTKRFCAILLAGTALVGGAAHATSSGLPPSGLPTGYQYQVNPTCNNGAPGVVGQTYNGIVCQLPSSGGGGGGGGSSPSATIGGTAPTIRSPMSYKDSSTGNEDAALGDGTSLYAKIMNPALPPLGAGAAVIGSISNTSFGISGTLPGFTSTPTFNLGTAPNLTLTNTAFGISGTLPGFASTPTFNIGTAPNLSVTDTSDGTDASSVTQPTGGAGIRGWLSGLYKLLGGTLTVTGNVTTTPATNSNQSVVQSTAANLNMTEANSATIAGEIGAVSSPAAGSLNAQLGQAVTALQSAATVPVACAGLGQSSPTAANCNTSTPNTVVSQTLNTGTVGNTTVLALPAAGESNFKLVVGSLAAGATLEVLGSADGGTTYPYIQTPFNTTTPIISAAGGYSVSVKGFDHIEFLVVAAATGTATLKGNLTVAPGDVAIAGLLPGFATPPSVADTGSAGAPLQQGTTPSANDLNIYATLQPSVGTRIGTAAIDQTTPGTTNGVQLTGPGATSANPIYTAPSIAATASAAINVSTATTTQLVAVSGTKSIYITSFDMVAAAADTAQFEYGTGTACGTGTTVLTGSYAFAANGGMSANGGGSPKLFVPAGNALCLVTGQAVQLSGSVSYAQQ